MSNSSQKSLIFLETLGAVVAAAGVAVGLIGVIWPWQLGIWIMIGTVFAYMLIRIEVGRKQIKALEPPPDPGLRKLAIKIIWWDAFANVVAAFGVGMGLLGVMWQSLVMIGIMLASIVAYAAAIGWRGRLMINYETKR